MCPVLRAPGALRAEIAGRIEQGEQCVADRGDRFAIAPLCTVHAMAMDAGHVTALLRERERTTLNMFGHASGQTTKKTIFSRGEKNEYC